MNDFVAEAKRRMAQEKAKNLRYKKPIAKGLNVEDMSDRRRKPVGICDGGSNTRTCRSGIRIRGGDGMTDHGIRMKQRCRAIEQMVLATSDPEERFRIYVRGELNERKAYERQRHFRRGKK